MTNILALIFLFATAIGSVAEAGTTDGGGNGGGNQSIRRFCEINGRRIYNDGPDFELSCISGNRQIRDDKDSAGAENDDAT